MTDLVNHPPHYKAPNGLEAIDVIEVFGFDKDFCLGNAAKYLLLAGRKDDLLQDLRKAVWYLRRKIAGIDAARGMPRDLRQFSLCYLATPYTKYAGGIDAAFQAAAKLAARLLKNNVRIYSPIAHTHPLAIHGGMDPLDHAIWLPFDEAMMEASDALVVAHMDGWHHSYGIQHEIKVFANAGKPIFDLDPDTLHVVRRGEQRGG